MSITVSDSHRNCQRVARRAASSFYWSFWLLPSSQRRAMTALYAFSRHTDDLGDRDASVEDREVALNQWRAAFAEALVRPSVHPLLPAVVDTLGKFEIPAAYLFDIIEGVAMDLHHSGFETMDDLRGYCYRVASAVGLACIHVWGYTSEAIRESAIECGVAFQMTNILRDLKEDVERGRVYLPREDLRRFGCTAEDLQRGVVGSPFAELLRFEIVRNEQLYDAAAPTRNYLRAAGRRSFDMMFQTYRALLHEIKIHPEQVLHRRIRVGLPRKLAIAAACCLRR